MTQPDRDKAMPAIYATAGAVIVLGTVALIGGLAWALVRLGSFGSAAILYFAGAGVGSFVTWLRCRNRERGSIGQAAKDAIAAFDAGHQAGLKEGKGDAGSQSSARVGKHP